MNILSKLPGLLRKLFAFLRVLSLIFGVFWLIVITYNFWFVSHTGKDARLEVTVGQILLPSSPDGLGLASNTASPGTLTISPAMGMLKVDIASSDAALRMAIYKSVFPMMVVGFVFTYFLFGKLRNLCGNLERGDVFSEENLLTVRQVGITLIVYSLVQAGTELWASHALSSYFSQHVTVTGLKSSVPFTAIPDPFNFFRATITSLTTQGGILVGLLVLVVAEAFRQGLKLKTENDLTV